MEEQPFSSGFVMLLRTQRTLFAVVLTGLSLLVACGDGGSISPPGSGGNPLSGQARVRLLVVGKPTPGDLFQFSVGLRAVRGVRQDGTLGENLLAEDLTIELQGPGFPRWIAEEALPAGAYRGLQIELVPFSARARALDGSPLLVEERETSFVARFPGIATFEREDRPTFLLRIDLGASVAGDPALGAVEFTPSASVQAVRGAFVEELDGIVRARDVGTLGLELEMFADTEREVSLTTVPVVVDGRTLLVESMGLPLGPPAFYYTLFSPGATVLELHGELLQGGAWRATRIEIEDQDGGAGDRFPVVLQGVIQELVGSVAFDLRVREIEKGAVLAEPILAGLIGESEPRVVRIGLDARSVIYAGENAIVDSSSLRSGQEVEIKFQGFSAEPFPAARIDIGPSGGAGSGAAD